MANLRDSTPLWSTCLELYPREEVRVEEPHWTLVHTYNCTQNSATVFSPYYLMYGRQPCLPVDVTLGLAPNTIMEPNTSKFVQKMREHAKWAQRKAEALQPKEAQQHKWNYDKRGRAVALEVRDMVLVCVTAFKGCHKIQDRSGKREYVVEKWPYPNVPVYVVCPRDGEGHSWTLHRNYLLPINLNIEQGERDKPMATVGKTTSPTPVPPVDSVPADAGSSGMITPSTAGSTTQGSPDQPASLRHGTRTTQNWLPWRYWNFGLLADTGLTGIWDAWVGLCICLHILFCLYTVFWGGTVKDALYLQHWMSAKHYSLQHSGEFPQCNLWGGLLGREGSGPKDIWPNCLNP